MPKRLFVSASLGAGFQDTILSKKRTDFSNDFHADLQSCGVLSEIAFVETTALHIVTDERMKSFAPDTSLSIQWTNAVTRPSSSLTGDPLVAGDFHLELMTLPEKIVVWNANIHLSAGPMGILGNNGDVFVTSIINRMVADRVLPANCLVPVK